MHVNDWLPTMAEDIAGLELDKDKWKLNGYNVWSCSYCNGQSNTSYNIKQLVNLDTPPKRFRCSSNYKSQKLEAY